MLFLNKIRRNAPLFPKTSCTEPGCGVEINPSAGHPVKARTVPIGNITPYITASDAVIYDRKNSGNARRLTSGLKAAGIPSKMIIIKPFGEGPFQDMKDKHKKAGYGNDISLPVAEVRGDMIMKPAVNDIKVMLIESIAP